MLLLLMCMWLLTLIKCYGYQNSWTPSGANRHKIPQEIMVDVINNLGLKLLAIHNENNENNIAISPYGASSVLVALAEGLQGDAAYEIEKAAQIPPDLSIIRIGLRDIHRHLKSYFIPEEGFLAGLTLSHENVTLHREYEEILRFYGYDINSFNNALYPDPNFTTEKSVSATSTTSTTTSSSTSITTVTPDLEEMSTDASSLVTTETTTQNDRTIRSEATTVPDKETTIELGTTNNMENDIKVSTEIVATTTDSSTEINKDSTTTKTDGIIGSTTTKSSTETLTTGASADITNIKETNNEFSSTSTTLLPVSTSTIATTTIKTSSSTTNPPTTIPSTTTSEIPTTTSTEPITSLPPISTTSTTTQPTTTVKLSTTTKAPTTSIKTISTTTDTTENTTTVEPNLITNDNRNEIVGTTSTESSTEDGKPATTIESSPNPVITTMVTTEGTITTTAIEDRISGSNGTNLITTVSTSSNSETTRSSDDSSISTTTEISSTTTEISGTTTNIDTTTKPADQNQTSTINNEITSPKPLMVKRSVRSIVDYIIARYYDDHTITQRPPPPSLVPPPFHNSDNNPQTFLINGKYSETNINFMTYDTVLPFLYISHLNTLALSFPLDSTKYYLLLLLPVDDNGIDKLICDLRLNTSLKYIIENLRYTHVKAIIPSFMLKGYVVLTPTFQKLGIRRVFEPRQADFSPMTADKEIYVTNIEQAVTVTIRNYVDPNTMNYFRNLHQYDPVYFKADHPFLYFVIDSEIHVTLMAGKIINPLNSRIR